jgi:hypothetical protein
MQHFAGTKGKHQGASTAHVDTLSIEDKLKFAIINGEKSVGEGAHKKTLEDLAGRSADSVLAFGTDQHRAARTA